MSKKQLKTRQDSPGGRRNPVAQKLCGPLARKNTSHLLSVPSFLPLIITEQSKAFKNLTKRAASVCVCVESQQAVLAGLRERHHRARVAGKTNLQFSLSIQKAQVHGACPLETEQTAVKMFKRLCFLRYLCS